LASSSTPLRNPRTIGRQRRPFVDFSINATGTLNLLEATRQHCPDACFIFTSTNKVYGDTPKRLLLVEQPSRWELLEDHPYGRYGIDESMSIDRTMHSLFGSVQGRC
jgi:CDP-paratose 2-epimerase